VTYTGTPTKVQVAVNERDTTYNTQVWKHFSSNSFTFLIYDDADGTDRDIEVTATLLGGVCSQQFKIEPYSYTALNSCNEEVEEDLCPDNLYLSDTAEDGIYQAVRTIESDQLITPDLNVQMRAENAVILMPGFHAQKGATLFINIETCQQ